MSNEHLDEIDSALLARRTALRDQIDGPRPGDFIRMENGTLRRFTHDHGEPHGLQTNTPGIGDMSFHLDRQGHMDYSGALDPCVPSAHIFATCETREGQCWFFHHDKMRAFNKASAMVMCRVYVEIKP